MDERDIALLRLLLQEPRAGMREYARTLGFPVLALVHLHLAQGRLDEVAAMLHEVPEALEALSIAGEGDLGCRVAARDNPHLEAVVQQWTKVPGVVRTKTEVVLSERVRQRVLPLILEMGRARQPHERGRRPRDR